jgi:hypothetical protein
MTWSTKRFLIIQYSLLVIAYIIFCHHGWSY